MYTVGMIMPSINTIKVSVVVPCYNVESYIRDCLDTLINQTLKEIEIICVDDGSTDSTPSILDHYKALDSRIVVLHQPNMKQGAARNNGMRHASGEWIAFVDSDDYVDLNYLEVLYSAAVTSGSDIAVCSMLKHKSHRSKYNIRVTKTTVATGMQEKIRICEDTSHRFFYVMSKIYRRGLLTAHSISFPENMYYEDVMFSARTIYHASRIVSTASTVYHYIKRPGSTVNSQKTEKKARDIVRAYVELADFAKKYGFSLPERTNYAESYWSSPFVKTYQGCYKSKKMLFGIIPVGRKNYGTKNPEYSQNNSDLQ